MRYTNRLGFAVGDRLSVVQSPSFSGTVSSLFGALLNGATAVMVDLHDPEGGSLGDWVRRERITVFHAVPAIFRQLRPVTDRYPALRLVRLEGDGATGADVALFRIRCRPDCVLVNGLGATECGLIRQYFVAGSDPVPAAAGPLPVGYPVPDMAVSLRDDGDRAVPIGEIGEIVVDSAFVAGGYWNNPTLTAARFSRLADGRRRYRTGDLGRIDEDGRLTHLGRLDQQTRIGGRTVDTTAIEAALLEQPGISQAVLSVGTPDGAEPRLVAYLVASGPSGPSGPSSPSGPSGPVDPVDPAASGLRRALHARLPGGPWPSAFVWLDELPLTADRKLDRRRLPAPSRARPRLPDDAIAPRDESESAIGRVWSAVLGIDGIGIDDPFLDLGGDSIRAAEVVSRLIGMQVPGFAGARATDLFEHPTIRALSDALARRARDGDGGPRPAPGDAADPDPPAGPADADPIAGAGPIAVIGMACRVPGAADTQSFWALLREGRETILIDPVQGDPTTPDPLTARGRLDDVDCFDAGFFGLTPRQAAALDPQQRVWLECVLHALEDAQMPAAPGPALRGAKVGVFAGGRASTYLWDLIGGNRTAVDRLLDQGSDEAQLLRIGNDTDSIATRTSFLLDLSGPAVNVQTACSTSLVAVALACDALRAGHCDAAIAGGVSITFPQRRRDRFQEGGIRSGDGRCRPFDAAASGTVFSDGAGAVVLKRLDDARRDGDRIHAVIRGWAVNNDGSDKASFTAPSAAGQAAVIRAAHRRAGVGPGQISYVETHGTGTPIGDPIEVEGLVRAFESREAHPAQRCAIGSVKSNIGHLDCAAGIVGLVKTVLALTHREIPATLHFRTPNPAIDFDSSPFHVADRAMRWEGPPGSRIAGVSSFGVGGTNCHLVVADAGTDAETSPDADAEAGGTPTSDDASPIALLTLSARSAAALATLARDHGNRIRQATDADWPRIAASAQRSRSGHPWRLTVLAPGRNAACAALASLDADTNPDPPQDPADDGTPAGRQLPSGTSVWRSAGAVRRPPTLGFVFAGPGDQAPGLARDLYRSEPVYRAALDRCDAILRRIRGVSLLDTLEAACRDPGLTSQTDISRTDIAQPALFALDWSLARLLGAWGVRPDLVAGHGLGEYTAACVAGVFSVEDGLSGAAERGQAHGPIRFEDAIAAMRAAGCSVFVEIGSHPQLLATIRSVVADPSVAMIATLDKRLEDRESLLRLLGRLHALGVPIDWAAVQGPRRRRPIDLPLYPFERTRHVYRPTDAGRGPPAAAGPPFGPDPSLGPDPLLGRRLRIAGLPGLRFETQFDRHRPAYLDDHRLFGVPIAPGAAHFAILAQAAAALAAGQGGGIAFDELLLLRPLAFPSAASRTVQLAFSPLVPETPRSPGAHPAAIGCRRCRSGTGLVARDQQPCRRRAGPGSRRCVDRAHDRPRHPDRSGAGVSEPGPGGVPRGCDPSPGRLRLLPSDLGQSGRHRRRIPLDRYDLAAGCGGPVPRDAAAGGRAGPGLPAASGPDRGGLPGAARLRHDRDRRTARARRHDLRAVFRRSAPPARPARVGRRTARLLVPCQTQAKGRGPRDRGPDDSLGRRDGTGPARRLLPAADHRAGRPRPGGRRNTVGMRGRHVDAFGPAAAGSRCDRPGHPPAERSAGLPEAAVFGPCGPADRQRRQRERRDPAGPGLADGADAVEPDPARPRALHQRAPHPDRRLDRRSGGRPANRGSEPLGRPADAGRSRQIAVTVEHLPQRLQQRQRAGQAGDVDPRGNEIQIRLQRRDRLRPAVAAPGGQHHQLAAAIGRVDLEPDQFLLGQPHQRVRHRRLADLERGRDLQRCPAVAEPHQMVEHAEVGDVQIVGHQPRQARQGELVHDAQLVEPLEQEATLFGGVQSSAAS